MEKKTTFSIGSFLVTLFLILVMQWLFFPPTLGIPEISYKTFKEKLATGEVKRRLGGRAAEEIALGEISTGASNDLEKVAQLARNMIAVYGMSEKLPNLSLVNRSGPDFLGQGNGLVRRSERMEQVIDEEVTRIINQCYEDAKTLLLDKRDLPEKLARVLLQKEVVDYREIKAILGLIESNPMLLRA